MHREPNQNGDEKRSRKGDQAIPEPSGAHGKKQFTGGFSSVASSRTTYAKVSFPVG